MSNTSDDSKTATGEKRRRVLYPTDFSEAAQAGLKYATALARDMDAVLVIAHVEEPMETYAGGEFFGPDEEIRRQLQENLAAIVSSDPNVVHMHRYERGMEGAAAGILRIAESEDVDLIVMGTHGRTGLPYMLMGSVTERVVRQSLCPVVTFTPHALARETQRDE